MHDLNEITETIHVQMPDARHGVHGDGNVFEETSACTVSFWESDERRRCSPGSEPGFESKVTTSPALFSSSSICTALPPRWRRGTNQDSGICSLVLLHKYLKNIQDCVWCSDCVEAAHGGVGPMIFNSLEEGCLRLYSEMNKVQVCLSNLLFQSCGNWINVRSTRPSNVCHE